MNNYVDDHGPSGVTISKNEQFNTVLNSRLFAQSAIIIDPALRGLPPIAITLAHRQRRELEDIDRSDTIKSQQPIRENVREFAP